MSVAEVLKLIFGSIFVLFVPGFAWSFLFFQRGAIDLLERVALSFGISIAFVPLTVFFANRALGVGVTTLNTAIIVLLLTVIPVACLYARRRWGPFDLGQRFKKGKPQT